MDAASALRTLNVMRRLRARTLRVAIGAAMGVAILIALAYESPREMFSLSHELVPTLLVLGGALLLVGRRA